MASTDKPALPAQPSVDRPQHPTPPWAHPEENPMIRFPRGARTTALALLAGLALPAAMAQDMLLARNLAATCANCHGTNGNARG
jgi:cytochrome c553